MKEPNLFQINKIKDISKENILKILHLIKPYQNILMSILKPCHTILMRIQRN